MRVVQIPSKLWIGNYEFELRLVTPEDNLDGYDIEPAERADLEREDGVMLSGPKHYVICIAAGIPMRRRLEIAFHEITHALNWLHDIKDQRAYVHRSEEEIAALHGRAWSQFYLDNPRFEAWLVYTLHRIRQDQRQGSGEPKGRDLVDTKTE